MADSTTTNYDFILPEVGSSRDTWGDKLNSNWLAIDLILAPDETGTFLPLAGGTLTGDLIIEGYDIILKSDDATSLVFEDIGGQTGRIRQLANGRIAVENDVTATQFRLAEGGGFVFRIAGEVSAAITVGDDTVPNEDELITAKKGDARYFQLTGSSAISGLVVNSVNTEVLPEVRFRRHDWTDNQYIGFYGSNDGNYLVSNSSGTNGKSLIFDNRTGGADRSIDFSQDGVVFASISAPNSAVPSSDATLLRRIEADNRYLQLTGGTVTDDLKVEGQVIAYQAGGSSRAVFALETVDYSNIAISGDPVGRTPDNGSTDDTLEIMTVGNLSWDLIEYKVTSNGRHDFYCGAANLDATIDSNGFYLFGTLGITTIGRLVAGATITTDGLVVDGGIEIDHNNSDAIINNGGSGNILLQTDGVTQAQLDSDGGLSDVNSLVRRGSGDTRYLRSSVTQTTEGDFTVGANYDIADPAGEGVFLNTNGSVVIQTDDTASSGFPILRAFVGTTQIFRLQASGSLRLGANADDVYTVPQNDARYAPKALLDTLLANGGLNQTEYDNLV